MSNWRKRIDKAKHEHRPKLRDWSKDGFARERAPAFEALRNLEATQTEPIDRVHCSELTLAQFISRYEIPERPVLIQGVPEAEGWRAQEQWTPELLCKKYTDNKFKCGEDDEGYSVKVKMKHFLEYQEHQQDDSPLYVFDSSFDGNRETMPILSDYAVPSYFPDDLFALVGEKKRPPYRWFLIGPKRSGTSVHIDPLSTSAWNTVISGVKRWVLFPPHTSKSIAKGKHVLKIGEDDEPINYFVDLLPRMRKDVNLHAMEFLQYPGETVYVPCNWWHAVINLTDTIAVTQNFCSRQNFDKVWRKTRTGRKGMSRRWFRCLEEKFPELAQRATALNQMDQFPFDAYKNRPQRSLTQSVLRTTCEEDDSEEEIRRGKHYRNSSRSPSRSRSRSRSISSRHYSRNKKKKDKGQNYADYQTKKTYHKNTRSRSRSRSHSFPKKGDNSKEYTGPSQSENKAQLSKNGRSIASGDGCTKRSNSSCQPQKKSRSEEPMNNYGEAF